VPGDAADNRMTDVAVISFGVATAGLGAAAPADSNRLVGVALIVPGVPLPGSWPRRRQRRAAGPEVYLVRRREVIGLSEPAQAISK
jgi:hypothetical protein